MNTSIIKLILIASAYFVISSAQAATPKAGEYGYMVLHDSQQSRTCRLDLGARTKYARPDSHTNIDTCVFGWPGEFHFEGAKSAVTIYIGSFYLSTENPRNDCDWNNYTSYRFEIKTFGSYAETQTFNYDDLFRTAQGDVVVPGVRLISKHRGSNINNKPLAQLFSCVRIVKSK